MMLVSRFRALFVRAEDVSAACLLLVYPTALLGTCWIYPIWERYGIRFQVLCNSALLAMAIIICSQSALNRFVIWLRQSIFIYLLPIWFIGLSLMGWRHGFGFTDAHQQGLISGFLGALCVPFICYVMYSVRCFWVLKILGLFLAAINIVECVFLGIYSHYGVGHNASFTLWGTELPRIFLNTRDGGAWSVLLVGFVYVLWCNAFKERSHGGIPMRDLFSYSLLLVPAYLLALLTSSRGVFVSVAFAFLIVRLFGVMRRNSWIGFFLVNAMSIIFAFCLRLIMGASVVEASSSGLRLVEVDQSRLQLWISWLKSISQDPNDWLLGKGFNYFPLDILPPGHWPANVHNLYVQIIVDSGLLGVGIVFISVILAFKFLAPILYQNYYLIASMCFGLSLFFAYSAVSAIIDWPSGCWIAFFVMSVSLGLTTNHKIFAYEIDAAPFNEILLQKYNLFLKAVAFLLFFAFLILQIPLIATRYTYLIPNALTSSSIF